MVMIDVDESSARAIIEHAKNLSGDISQTVTCSRADGADELPTGCLVTEAENPAPPRTDAPSPAQFPSEGGHWYDPKTGNQIELPPRTQARTAIKRGFVPGVTSVTKVAHKEAIQRWMVNRAIKFTQQALLDWDDPRAMWDTSSSLAGEVWRLLDADSEATTGRGKELHGAIEQCAQGKHPGKWDKHVDNVISQCDKHGIPSLRTGNTEHSFATSRYGGKIDWHNDEWLIDFKTKPRIEKGKKLAYPEHAQQLAAYAWGLFPFKQYSEKAFMFSDNKRRCANVFIGVEDAEVVFHEWSEKDLLKGWRKFEALLNVWWCDYEH